MKAKRSIIKIDEALCDGCGACAKGCHEGALQMIDGKARIVSELYCDGLGACIGDCPVGAITIEEREAEPYNENAVMKRIVPKGEATILAHLRHLKEHGETRYLNVGIDYLRKNDIGVNINKLVENDTEKKQIISESQLTHWPVQLHLLNPQAGFLQGADVIIAADCTAYAFADFHNRFLRNNKLAIACPKLDSNKEVYVSKIAEMIDMAQINTITVVIMEVPCCGGLLQLVKMAVTQASRKVPIKKVVIGVQGDIIEEEWDIM